MNPYEIKRRFLSQFLPRSLFSKQVAILLAGAIVAQALPILISPVITRIFTPSDLGAFLYYSSIVAILSVVATGRYELAVVIAAPNDDSQHEVKNLIALVVILVTTFAFALFIVTHYFGEDILSALNRPELRSVMNYAPLSIILIGIFQLSNNYHIKMGNYRTLSSSKVLMAGGGSVGQIGFGMANFGVMGLLLANLLSYVAAIAWMNKSFSKNAELKMVSPGNILRVAKKYKNFPVYDVPSMLVNLVANQIPIIVIGSYFGLSYLGLYALVTRVLMAPIGLISNAILDVFKKQASEDFGNNGNCSAIYNAVLKKLVFLSVFPTFLVMLFAREGFAFFFGQSWREAGVMAQILAPAFMLNFIVNPLSYTIYIANKQYINFRMNLIYMTLILMAATVGVIANQLYIFLAFLSAAQCANYTFYLYVSRKISEGK